MSTQQNKVDFHNHAKSAFEADSGFQIQSKLFRATLAKLGAKVGFCISVSVMVEMI
jgi:hypothetical protein